MRKFIHTPRLCLAWLLILFILASCSQHTLRNTQETSSKDFNFDRIPVSSVIDQPNIHAVKLDTELSRNIIAESLKPAADSTKEESHRLQALKSESLWLHLFKLYSLPEVSHNRIEKDLRWFLDHPKFIERVQIQAEPYLFSIVEQIEAQNLPGEIALLPVIESAFKPHAYSPASAAGLWQFIPTTGRLYGLKQNWWYDGRRDVYASTQAAIKYLKKLHTQFDGDWLLALAAYNCGEGKVARSINKNLRKGKAIDFWSLSLPRETRSYVPRLLAVAKLFSNAEKYRIKLRPILNEPVFEKVDIGSQIDLATAANLADLSIERLFQFNPGYNQWATDPDGPHHLLIPLEKSKLFKKNLAQTADKDRIQWKRHHIRFGETLSHIAQRYKTTTRVVRKVNKLNSNHIRAGRFLIIPVAAYDPSHYVLTQNQRKIASKQSMRKAQKVIYTVRSGDTFWDISNKFEVGLSQLARWNNMSSRDILHPGKKLSIWLDAHNQTAAINESNNPFQTIDYRVRKGDSLYLISRRFKVSVADLRKWNASKMGKYLQPGQTLKLRISEALSTT